MSLSVSPSEVKAVTAVLEQDWETSQDAAKAAIHALVEERAKRKSYLVVSNPGHVWMAWGPYPTYAKAEKGCAVIPRTHEEQRFALVPFFTEEEQ